MTWTPPKTWAASETVEAAELNIHIRDNLNFLYTAVVTAPPYHVCIAFRTSSQSIPPSADTIIQLPDLEPIDTDGFHDLVTNPSRFTIPAALVPVGYTAFVTFEARIIFASNATGYRGLRILRSGALASEVQTPAVSGATQGLLATSIVSVIAGDYLEMDCYQNSGGSLNVLAANANIFVVGIQPT